MQSRHARHVRKWTLALVALVALAATACSSSSATSTGASGPSDQSSGPAALPDNKATGEPIKVGFVNNEGAAAFSTPEISVGSKVAADLVNDKFNGVNG